MARKRPTGTRAPNGASSIYLGTDGKWHGRVTVGVKDDGSPDRRHVERKTEAEVIVAVRKLERDRENGTVRKAGRAMTVEAWLTHWVENIARPSVKYKSYRAYRTAVDQHLTPGVGKHRIDKIAPEHFEKLYARMIAAVRGRRPRTRCTVRRARRSVRQCAVGTSPATRSRSRRHPGWRTRRWSRSRSKTSSG